jgi:peptide chain release factor 2
LYIDEEAHYLWLISRTLQYWRNCVPLKKNCRKAFDLVFLESRLQELEKKTVAPSFWGSGEARGITQQLSWIRDKLGSWSQVVSEFQDLETLEEMLREGDDKELQSEFDSRSVALKKEIERMQLLELLNEDYDHGNAILSIHAGSGGLDSQDWADMLYRMYVRWIEQKDFHIKILDLLKDAEAGINSVTLLVEGNYAYGYLKSEKGVHRLVRISPFDSAGRRHTSFASVDVVPELPEDVDIEIRPEDIRIDTFRSSGAGGQYVNMTDSAVRITHFPSGIVVSCQNERSQHMNRAVAMQILKSRLYQRALEERHNELETIGGEKKEISWGSQIRSYVLHPYTLVKDHRTGCETGNVQAVLDGELEDFIMAYLRWKKQSRK